MAAAKTRKSTALEIEVYAHQFLARNKNVRICVPNVSWGMGVHECDLYVVKKSLLVTEVEIKISRADLKKDAEKGHGHSQGKKIHELYFAIPDYMEKDIDLIPEHAGILILRYGTEYPNGYKMEELREPKSNTKAEKLTPTDLAKLAYLASYRIWSMKDSLYQMIKNFERVRSGDRYSDLEKQIESLKKLNGSLLRKEKKETDAAWEKKILESKCARLEREVLHLKGLQK